MYKSYITANYLFMRNRTALLQCDCFEDKAFHKAIRYTHR